MRLEKTLLAENFLVGSAQKKEMFCLKYLKPLSFFGETFLRCEERDEDLARICCFCAVVSFYFERPYDWEHRFQKGDAYDEERIYPTN